MRFRRRHECEPAPPPPADLDAAQAAVTEAQRERSRVQALWLPTKALSARLRQQRVDNHFAARFEAAYGQHRKAT